MTFLPDFQNGIGLQDLTGTKSCFYLKKSALHEFYGKIDTNECLRAEDVATPMCLNPGDILRDRYIIDRALGRGGFGVTYLALDLATFDWVVVKEIPQPISQEDLQEARIRFEQEVEALIQLEEHSPIPQLVDSFEERGNFYSVQEYDVLHDRYLIDRELGRGGFGVTYLALDLATFDWVVVKEIPQPPSEETELLEQATTLFEREVEALIQLGEHLKIPKFVDSFEEGCNEEQGYFYLVQEYIEGHPLKNEFISNLLWNEADTLALLRDILEVLAFVHQPRVVHQCDVVVVHRDLHPGNLIRCASDGKIALIDFGAVKEIGTLESNDNDEEGNNEPEFTTRAIGIPGYMPPEQTRRVTKPSSDIYAVGCTCIQALTGLHPNQFQSQFSRDEAGNLVLPNLPIRSKFREILQTMVRYHFNDRYSSAVEALEAVRELEKPWWCDLATRLALGLAIVCGGVAIGIAGWRLLAPDTCSSAQNDHLSCGEEILVGGNPISDKKEGVDAFAREDYQKAISFFEEARQQQRNDPETLIYLNNAKLAASGDRIYTIAVVVPLEKPANWQTPGLEVLRGVAQAQDAINNGKDFDWKLQVLVANDDNDELQAQNIAGELGKRSGVIAVVGHSTSATTLAAMEIYKRHQQVLISATSSSDELTGLENPFFFRTLAGEENSTHVLAEYLLEKFQQAAIFYNPGKPASRSLRDGFSKHFQAGGGTIVAEIDLSERDFDARARLERVRAKGANGLLLFPDAQVDGFAFPNALKVLEANDNRDWMGAGTGLYATDILEEKDRAQKLVVTVPWHMAKSPNSEFPEAGKNLWGETVGWRTATAYDATQVLVEAIEAQSSLNPIEVFQTYLDPKMRSRRLQKTLADANFSATGATGTIQFEATGDRRNPSIELVRVLPCGKQPFGFSFVPIEFSTAAEAGIVCDR